MTTRAEWDKARALAEEEIKAEPMSGSAARAIAIRVTMVLLGPRPDPEPPHATEDGWEVECGPVDGRIFITFTQENGMKRDDAEAFAEAIQDAVRWAGAYSDAAKREAGQL